MPCQFNIFLRCASWKEVTALNNLGVRALRMWQVWSWSKDCHMIKRGLKMFLWFSVTDSGCPQALFELDVVSPASFAAKYLVTVSYLI